MRKRGSVLVIGGSGRLGRHICGQLFHHTLKPKVHVFCRNLKKQPDEHGEWHDSVIEGNAREYDDVEYALERSAADYVVVSIGDGDNVVKTDLRAASANVLVTALQKARYRHIKVYLVSSSGAVDSPIIAGCDLGAQVLQKHLVHVLADHTGQEQAFEPLRDRTVIVRPAALTENMPTGNVQLYDLDCDTTKLALHVDREDVARWIVGDMTQPMFQGKAVNITGIHDVDIQSLFVAEQ